MLPDLLDSTFRRINRAISEPGPQPRLRQTGRVASIGGGIAQVAGLPEVGYEELVAFPGGLLGLAMNLEPDQVGVMLLGDGEGLNAGVEVTATGRVADVAVGEALIGRVVDATGRVLDHGGRIELTQRFPIERPAPAIIDRLPVNVPLETGIKVVDTLIPVGRGQRELILGDRQTGKTSIAVDAIINQRDKNVICIYCAIGQRGTAVARVVESLQRHDAMKHSIVVVGADDDAPGLRFITPYAATSIAEYFMEQDRDVLIVYDDLTRHARAYRELSLLLRRPPGREAYPGDIFYIHSRLLERATHLSEQRGGGSLTALPVIETQAQDISAYIPTNLISMTDGQIYLSPRLFRRGWLPAIDVGKSVSRVGGDAQFPALRAVASDLRLAYSQFEELESFARFSARLDADTRAALERGQRVREALKQPERQPLRSSQQALLFHALNAGLLDEIPIEAIGPAENALHAELTRELPELCRRIDTGQKLAEEDWSRILDAARSSLRPFRQEGE